MNSMIRDTKYLIAYLAPLAAFWGVYAGGIWSPGAFYVGFVMIPLLELFLPGSTRNLSPAEETEKTRSLFFDLLLYLNIPVFYALLWYFFQRLHEGGLQIYEIIGMTLSVGVIAGTIGINVAHELGHRSSFYEQTLAKILLLPTLYMHFFIEHNRGHHKNVATDEDPASARRGENLYAFWWRSVSGGYRNAWQLERERLQREGKSALRWDNEMLRFQVFQAAYLLAVWFWWGYGMLLIAMAVAAIGILLLESVNYIEHYGLRRERGESGRYEPVLPRHSWNSNHELGRIFLYELTRHSDHHYKATRKYQILRHHEDSPQLPLGYPGAILVSLLPPLWFRLMDKRIQNIVPLKK